MHFAELGVKLSTCETAYLQKIKSTFWFLLFYPQSPSCLSSLTVILKASLISLRLTYLIENLLAKSSLVNKLSSAVWPITTSRSTRFAIKVMTLHPRWREKFTWSFLGCHFQWKHYLNKNTDHVHWAR